VENCCQNQMQHLLECHENSGEPDTNCNAFDHIAICFSFESDMTLENEMGIHCFARPYDSELNIPRQLNYSNTSVQRRVTLEWAS